ncbi:BQ2448_3035 [Microbotryum intermedium]|uniref:BQ2448_3035 protein n=1 Tax=Microbotryum intermedium TaxID=269621 RepID=A0A238FE11_9BASI|nr:BQ2448_3035 [Microbotryum intermedium]
MSGDPSAMDPRLLPPGWMTHPVKTIHRTWFYINTNVDPPASAWEHPADTTKAGSEVERRPVNLNDDDGDVPQFRRDEHDDNLQLLPSGLGVASSSLLDLHQQQSRLETHP